MFECPVTWLRRNLCLTLTKWQKFVIFVIHLRCKNLPFQALRMSRCCSSSQIQNKLQTQVPVKRFKTIYNFIDLNSITSCSTFVQRGNIFSCSSYCKSFNLVWIWEVHLCTFSKILISPWRYRFHIRTTMKMWIRPYKTNVHLLQVVNIMKYK